MFEGKEYEHKIGEYGSASVDVTGDLKVQVQVGVEIDLVLELKKLAENTSTPVDDAAIAWVESMFRKA